MPTYPDPRVGMATFIQRPDGRFLVGLRRGSHGAGTWGLVGGTLEAGESWEECTLREAREEIGLDVTYTGFLTATNDLFPEGKHYVTLFVTATVPADAQPILMEPDKCVDWAWVTWAEMAALPLMAGLDTLLGMDVTLPIPG